MAEKRGKTGQKDWADAKEQAKKEWLAANPPSNPVVTTQAFLLGIALGFLLVAFIRAGGKD